MPWRCHLRARNLTLYLDSLTQNTTKRTKEFLLLKLKHKWCVRICQSKKTKFDGRGNIHPWQDTSAYIANCIITNYQKNFHDHISSCSTSTAAESTSIKVPWNELFVVVILHVIFIDLIPSFPSNVWPSWSSAPSTHDIDQDPNPSKSKDIEDFWEEIKYTVVKGGLVKSHDKPTTVMGVVSHLLSRCYYILFWRNQLKSCFSSWTELL